MSDITLQIASRAPSIVDAAKKKMDAALVRYDAWFVVLLAVLLVLATAIFAGLVIWCVVYKGKRFSGNWNWHTWGVSVDAQCV